MGFLRQLAAVAGIVAAFDAQAEPPRLDLPVGCVPGETCWVVNYVDHEPGPGVRDYHCGALAYDGHDGTDIAVRDLGVMADGIAVVAAAPGTIKAARDGMADAGLDSSEPGTIKGRECGNGVLVAHDDGWETQYCHMRRGSVAVRPGDTVARGQRLGLIGRSGRTEFPHLHLTVRRHGNTVDPFLGGAPFGACQASADTLWSAEASSALRYRRAAIYNAGFAADRPSPDAIRNGKRGPAPTAAGAALILWADIFGVEAGDRIAIRVVGPGGSIVFENSSIMDRRQARRFEYAGRRTPPTSWPAGTYTGEITITRDGAVIDRRQDRIAVR